MLQFAGATLPVRQSVIYLGYQLSHRGTWGEHVDRRLSKAVKWDGVARSMLGKTIEAQPCFTTIIGHHLPREKLRSNTKNAVHLTLG